MIVPFFLRFPRVRRESRVFRRGGQLRLHGRLESSSGGGVVA